MCGTAIPGLRNLCWIRIRSFRRLPDFAWYVGVVRVINLRGAVWIAHLFGAGWKPAPHPHPHPHPFCWAAAEMWRLAGNFELVRNLRGDRIISSEA